jgi:type IX secretion system PorP/SprF family membrane protein
MGGPVMQRFDPSQLTFDDQFVNGAYSSTNPTKQVFTNTGSTYWDLTAGLTFSSVAGADTRFYLGAAMFHILKPKVAFQKQYDIVLNQKYVVNAGLSKSLNNENKIILYADYFMQGGARQVQGGLMLSHDFLNNNEDQKIALTGGVFYRSKDALIPVVKIDYNKLGLGFNYDVNISKLRTASQMRGSFEVTFSYKGFTKSENSSVNKVRCPAFY